MASDSGPQESPPPWHAAGAPEQLLSDALARERRRRRALLADEQATHHGVAAGHAIAPTAEGSSEETTTGPATAFLLLPSEIVASFSKEALDRLCKGSSAPATLVCPLEHARLLQPLCSASQTNSARDQIVSSTDTSTEHLMSYLQDPKSVRLLAEKTREIWKVSYIDGVEECFTVLPMHLLVADEKISAPTKRLHCDSVVGEVLQGSSEETKTGLATALLLPSEVVGSFSKEVLGRLCKGSSAPATLLLPLEHARAQAVSPTDNSSEHLMSYLQDPKSVRLLAEKVSHIDGVEECFTVLPVHLLVAQDKISVPTKRLHCNSAVGEVLQVGDMNSSSTQEPRNVWLLLKNGAGNLRGKICDLTPRHSVAAKRSYKALQGSSEETAMLDTVMLLPSSAAVRNFSKETLSTQEPRHPTLEKYLKKKKKMFTVEVALPDGRISLQMTMKGCQFLSSWIKCFTTAFSRGKSWNGQFELKDFKCVDGHVRIIKVPKRNCPTGAVARDLAVFVRHVRDTLQSNNANLVSKYPPYVEEFISYVNSRLPILNITNVLSSEDTLFLETHVCCMTSYARGRLIIELFRKYEGRDVNQASDWEAAIDGAKCSNNWPSYLPTKSSFFTYVIEKGKGKGVYYNDSKTSAFIFIKDIVVHATDSHTEYSNAAKLDAIKLAQGLPPQLGDGIELMIPADLGNFLPTIILNLIEKKVDISAELLAAIQCACTLCDSSESSSESSD